MTFFKKLLKKVLVFKITPFEPRIPAPGCGRRINIDDTDRQVQNRDLAKDSGKSKPEYKRTQHK